MNKKTLALVILFFAVVGAGAFALAKWNAQKASLSGGADTGSPAQQEAQASSAPAWQKRCSEPQESDGVARCEIYQTLIIRESQKRFLEIAVSSRAEDEWVAAVLAPLGISLKRGGLLQIDGEKTAEQFAFDECGSTGCFARFLLKPDFLRRMQGSGAIFVGFYNADGKLIQVKLPMNGFSEALERLK